MGQSVCEFIQAIRGFPDFFVDGSCQHYYYHLYDFDTIDNGKNFECLIDDAAMILCDIQ